MTAAPLAALAGALAVIGLWELAGAVGRPGRMLLVRRLADLFALLARAGRVGAEPTPPERQRLVLAAVLLLLAAGTLLAGPLAGLALAAAGPWALGAVVRRRRRRHRAELERAVPGIARALADALAAGHTISRALAEAADGVDGAASGALRTVAGALAVGQSLDAALTGLRARAGSRAYDTLVTAILLQRDAGGDLVALLREIARAREAAARCAEDARAATAQARFTGVVVGVLPAGAAALAELASPGALAGVLRVPPAAWLAAFAVVLQAVGLVAIRRLGRVP